jgi:hypothetical protein
MVRVGHGQKARSHEGGCLRPQARGVVARSGGALVRRVSTYVDLATYDRLRAKAGDTMTVSEVAGAAIVASLEPPRPRRAGR